MSLILLEVADRSPLRVTEKLGIAQLQWTVAGCNVAHPLFFIIVSTQFRPCVSAADDGLPVAKRSLRLNGAIVSNSFRVVVNDPRQIGVAARGIDHLPGGLIDAHRVKVGPVAGNGIHADKTSPQLNPKTRGGFMDGARPPRAAKAGAALRARGEGE